MTILKIRNVIAIYIAKEIKKITKITTIANKLKRIMQNITQLAQVTSYILQGNIASFNFKTLIFKKSIIISLKL